MINTSNKKNIIRKNFPTGLNNLVSISLGFLLLLLGIKSFEIIFIWPSILNQNLQVNYLLHTFFYELIIYFEVVAICGFIFLLINIFLQRTAKVILIVFYVLISLFALMLELYFSKAKVPLGSDLFGYSLFEINKTVTAAGGVSLIYVIYLLAFVLVLALILFLFSKIKLSPNFNYFFISIALITYFFISDLNPKAQNYTNMADYFAEVDKLQFFTSRTYTYFFEKEEVLPVYNFYLDSSDSTEISFKYTDSNYPFLHEENSPDVLSSFFNKSDKKPNFIIILTEGLGRGYSGANASLGSFTPFLDSLAEHSLCWENFLSTSGRTFAVFSSILGSLPFGERGFLEMGVDMPDHFSLISYLKKYNYKIHFYYGGDGRFDMMDVFFKKEKADQIIDEKNFGGSYKKMPPKASGFSWGYGDKELFKRSFDIIDQSSQYNQLNIYMTLSMHDPFIVENMDYYHSKFDEILRQNNPSAEVLRKVNNYKEMLSCVLYTDDAFREFFEAYKKRDDFNNTIFIITGDHRMPEIPIVNQIDRFYVPFIIYSPLLKRETKFYSISSHFDFLPSIIQFLSNNYGMEKIKYSTFIGSGIDTTRIFRNIHHYPLMRNKNELLDYLYNDYLLADRRLYKIIEDMGLVPIEESYMENIISNEFADFKRRNENMIQTKKLIPENLLN